ncbi:DUF1778 domain-containing protein [Aeromonas dhakensis]|uniref:type II toxin-antitoxin system TacA family antitoxin n=1 Tax=Aeromonas TaxID=642 RepID=UPI001BD688E7|nr:DUF1778 domain-containing protein [Aeromonas caviae]MBS4719620.1 DUF1778 domain-containing protein [Aeromonas caviae]
MTASIAAGVAKGSSNRVDMRLEPLLKELFETAAFISGVSLSSFMKTASMKMAEEILERERTIRLGAEAHDKFMSLLAAPVQVNPQMKAAISNVMNGEFEIEYEEKGKI